MSTPTDFSGPPTELAQIPEPTSNNMLQVAKAVKQNLEVLRGIRGHDSDAAVTWRDLLSQGFWTTLGIGATRSFATNGSTVVQTVVEVVDLPTAPTNVLATSGYDMIYLTWDVPGFRGFFKAQVYFAATDNVGAAVLLDETDAMQYVHLTSSTTGFYYWVRFVNKNGDIGSFQGVAGVFGKAAVDVTYLNNLLNASFASNSQVFKIYAPGFAVGSAGSTSYPFKVVSAPYTNSDGVVVPAGTYMDSAFIESGTIQTAAIRNAAITNAKIADLNVSKLTAGNISAGQYVRSSIYTAGSTGWSINADGSAEFRNIVARGDIQATSLNAATGTFTGTVSAGTVTGSTITGGTISGTTVTGSTVTGSTVSGNTITGGTVSGTNISGSLVTASTLTSSSVIASIVRDTGSTNVIDLTATGTAPFISTASGTGALIRANGTTRFQNSLFSGNVSVNIVVPSVTGTVPFGPYESTKWVEIPINVSYPNDPGVLTAVVKVVSFQPAGTTVVAAYYGDWQVVAQPVWSAPAQWDGASTTVGIANGYDKLKLRVQFFFDDQNGGVSGSQVTVKQVYVNVISIT